MKAEDLEGFDEYNKQPSSEIVKNGNSWVKLHSRIINELGPIPAMVFGAIEAYSRMDSGLCYASQARIASRVGIARKTVNEAIPKLEAGGFIKNLTPERRNRPHKLKVLWDSTVT